MIGKVVLVQRIKSGVMMLLGVLSAAIGLKGFLMPNSFIDGGAMGISLLSNILTGWNLSLLILLINLPFIFLGYKVVSWQFMVKSLISIAMLAILVDIIQIPVVTDDPLLIAFFGGLFIGAGTGLSMRGGSVIDGSEILAIFVSRRTSLTVGSFIAIFNIVLFCFAALFVSVETAMYSLLTYLAASRMIDFIVNGIEEYIGVTIISPKFNEIRAVITKDLGHAVTIYKSEGGYKSSSNADKQILFCVVTRLEITTLLNTISGIDSNAFIVQHTLRDSHNGMLKRRPMAE